MNSSNGTTNKDLLVFGLLESNISTDTVQQLVSDVGALSISVSSSFRIGKRVPSMNLQVSELCHVCTCCGVVNHLFMEGATDSLFIKAAHYKKRHDITTFQRLH